MELIGVYRVRHDRGEASELEVNWSPETGHWDFRENEDFGIKVLNPLIVNLSFGDAIELSQADKSYSASMAHKLTR